MNFEKKLMAYKVIAILLLGFSLAGAVRYEQSAVFPDEGAGFLPPLLTTRILADDFMVLEHHFDVSLATGQALRYAVAIFNSKTVGSSGKNFRLNRFNDEKDWTVGDPNGEGVNWLDDSPDFVIDILTSENADDKTVIVRDLRVNLTLGYFMVNKTLPKEDSDLAELEQGESRIIIAKMMSVIRDQFSQYAPHINQKEFQRFRVAFSQNELQSMISFSGVAFSILRIGQATLDPSDPRFESIGHDLRIAWNSWPSLYHYFLMKEELKWVIWWNVRYRLILLAWVGLVAVSLIWLVRLNLKSSLHKEIKLLGLPLETTNFLFYQNWKFRIWPVKESLIREVVNCHHLETDQQQRKKALLQKADEVLSRLGDDQVKPEIQQLLRIIFNRDEVLNKRERALNELLAVEERLRRLAAKEPVQAVETPAEEDRPLPKLKKGEPGGPRTEALNRIRSFTDDPLPELVLGLSARKLEYLHRTLLLVRQGFGSEGVKVVIKHPQLEHLLNLQSAMMQAVLNEDSARVAEIMHLTEVGAGAQ